MAEEELPQGFLEDKALHPEYYEPPGIPVPPIEKQIAVWKQMNRMTVRREAEKSQNYKLVDKDVEKENKQAVEDEWTELVHTVTKPVITHRMRNLLKVHQEHSALATIMDEEYGKNAKDGGVIRYDSDRDAWMVFRGQYWVEDKPAIFVIGLARALLFDMAVQAAEQLDVDMQKAIHKCQSSNGIKGALIQLKSLVEVKQDVFDTNPDLINMLNGTYNVKTGRLQEYNKNDYITRISGVEYNPSATCEKWIKHMRLVIPDVATRVAFQMYIGHSLVAGNPENAAMFAYGSGKNGKTVSFSTIDAVFDKYASGANAATFVEKMNDDAPRPDLARMKGSLLITVPEGKQGRRLDEGVLKNLTGGSDDVTARFLYGREFSFKPTAKLCFHTNHLPKIIGRDNGIWRRIYPIPFTQVIPEESRIVDYDKLLFATEGSGIFNWMVKGYRMYKAWGSLLYTSKIDEARSWYKEKTDVLGDFFEEYKITNNPEDRVGRSDLYKSYKAWCDYGNANEKPYPKGKFNDMIEERVGPAKKTEEGWFWIGIKEPDYAKRNRREGS